MGGDGEVKLAAASTARRRFLLLEKLGLQHRFLLLEKLERALLRTVA